MKYSIDLQPVFECSHCKAILDEAEIEVTVTIESRIKHCPVCGCCDLVVLKIE